jgi:hypothetical protein
MEMTGETTAFNEFEALQTIDEQLRHADEQARSRMLAYMFTKYGGPVAAPHVRSAIGPATAGAAANPVPNQNSEAGTYGTFAELYDAAQPQTHGEKALVAGYWLQVCGGNDEWPSQDVNNLLKNQGHGVKNITAALGNLKVAKPAFALQLKKSGKSQQSRKLYKLTVAGINAVNAMIARGTTK